MKKKTKIILGIVILLLFAGRVWQRKVLEERANNEAYHKCISEKDKYNPYPIDEKRKYTEEEISKYADYWGKAQLDCYFIYYGIDLTQ